MSVNAKNEEKAQPIHVFIRPRPFNKQEARSSSCIEVVSTKELKIKQQYGKRYQFDRVFDLHSKQIDVYKNVIMPLIPEVIAGYNCTVFAYGQTGTGKTYTMAGPPSTDVSWENDVEAGIIPRAMAHLFNELSLIPQQYSVRVSYLELYNEELFDLMSDNLESKSIRLFEDQHQKGSVIINGLSSETVHNKNEVYSILQKGQDRRRTASTLLNAQSSRSHTVFIIMVHTSETTVEGEELVKTGKLNLVDLAGSENISRSGAIDRRAREAGNINQSLLTLGRVIKALVEKLAHVPYRESKLTRILQDSLGGRTKTSIIATISPAASCLEETLSTLEYAYRARHITNRPEVNQRVCHKAWKAQYEKEMDRLVKDLNAARTANGIYLDAENYHELIASNENFKQEVSEKAAIVRELELQLKNLEEERQIKETEWDKIMQSFEDTRQELERTRALLEKADQRGKEQEHLANCFEAKAETLHDQARHLLSTTETTVMKYQQKIEVLCSITQSNRELLDQMAAHVLSTCEKIADDLITFMLRFKNTNTYLSDTAKNFDSKLHSGLQLITNREQHMYSEVKQFVNNATTDLDNALNQDFTQSEIFLNSIRSKLEDINDMSKWVDVKINMSNCTRKIKSEISTLQSNVQKQSRFNEEILTSIEAMQGQIELLSKELNNTKEKVVQSTAVTPSIQESLNNIEDCTEKGLSQIQALQDNTDYSTSKVREILEIVDNCKNQENARIVLEQLQNCYKAIIESTQNNVEGESNHSLKTHIQNIVDIADVHKDYIQDTFSEYCSTNNEILDQLTNLTNYSVEHDSSVTSKLQQIRDDLPTYFDGVKCNFPSPVKVSKHIIVEPSPRDRILSRFRNKMENVPSKVLEFDEDSTGTSTFNENGQIPIIDTSNLPNFQHDERKKVQKDGKENTAH